MDSFVLVVGWIALSVIGCAVIGVLLWLALDIWEYASNRFRDVYKAESLIFEYRKNRDDYLEWTNRTNIDFKLSSVSIFYTGSEIFFGNIISF